MPACLLEDASPGKWMLQILSNHLVAGARSRRMGSSRKGQVQPPKMGLGAVKLPAHPCQRPPAEASGWAGAHSISQVSCHLMPVCMIVSF